jgi:DNA transformation protein
VAVDAEHIRDLFAAFGTVSLRRMFGGAGIYAGETMFALVTGGVIYLKADEQTRGAFEEEGLAPFAYLARGEERVLTSYWRMPDRLYDDPDELARWAAAALAAAGRAAQAPRRLNLKRCAGVKAGGKPRSGR